MALVLMGVASATTAGQAYLLEPIINKIFVNKSAEYLLPISLAVVALFAVRGLAILGNVIIMSYIGYDIVNAIQKRMFDRLVRQDMEFFQKNSAGSLISLMVSDVMQMRSVTAEMMTGLGKNVLTLIFLVGVMFYQDWKLSLIALLVLPPAMAVMLFFGRRLRKVARSTQEEQAQLSSLFNQSFLGMRQVKAYNAEDYENERIDGALLRMLRLGRKTARVMGLSQPFSEVLAGVAIALIVLYGGSQVIDGTSTPGKFFSFIGAFVMANEPIKRLAKLGATMQVGMAAAARVFAAIDLPLQVRDAPKAVPLIVRQPTITFEKVSFAYPDGQKALDNVSFHVAAGQKAALVGPSGSGKTTCLQLLLRFFDVDSGRILIDGQNIRDVTVKSLRDALALVTQDAFIFDDTVAENIAYSQGHDVPMARIEEAARKAAAHEFITRMESGYETRLGELGSRLSGGQKQRISIARAILKDAPILLLDEATSALDTESEKLVTDGLAALQKGRTTLVVAHRLTTIRDADQIIVMDHGRVVSSGAHDSLMTQGGLYPLLYQSMMAA